MNNEKDGLGLSSLDYKINRIKSAIKNRLASKAMIFMYTYHFGFRNAVNLYKVKNDRNKWLDTCSEIIEDKLSGFLSNYAYISLKNFENKKRVWICWFQGSDNCPTIVQQCIASVKKTVCMILK